MSDSTIYELDALYGQELTLNLRPGNAWALYMDDGPGGPCGQSMRTTCPHSVLYIWPDEASMRKAMETKNLGRNKRARWMYGVVGEWTTPGVFQIRIQQENTGE